MNTRERLPASLGDRLLAHGADQGAITCHWLRLASLFRQGVLAHFFLPLLGAVEYIGQGRTSSFGAWPIAATRSQGAGMEGRPLGAHWACR